MTVLTRWEPFREFSTLQDRMNRLFRESYSGEGRDESLATSSFAPAVDVYEDEHQVTLKIEVPGIEEKDINVRVENNTLTVHGERKIREGRERRELPPCGAPVRQLHPHLHSAPDRRQRERLGQLRQGCVEDPLPKKAEAKPKQIKVNGGGGKSIEGKTSEGKSPSKAA